MTDPITTQMTLLFALFGAGVMLVGGGVYALLYYFVRGHLDAREKRAASLLVVIGTVMMGVSLPFEASMFGPGPGPLGLDSGTGVWVLLVGGVLYLSGATLAFVRGMEGRGL